MDHAKRKVFGTYTVSYNSLITKRQKTRNCYPFPGDCVIINKREGMGGGAMKCIRTAIEAEVFEYEGGMQLEDGFALYEKVITNGFADLENLIIIDKEGQMLCPYIKNRRGCTFIKKGDYIILDGDGTKHVCGPDKIWQRYQKVEE